MSGPTDSGHPVADADPEADVDSLPSEQREDVLDWLDRIIPVAIGSGSSMGRASETERLSNMGVGTAQMASLHAQAQSAKDSGNEVLEREALSKLARTFASRGYHLASAIHAARRSLQLGEDDELRAELSLWLEGLGEPATAASTLRALVATASTARDAARLLSRIGRLLIRAGDYEGALDAMSDASKVWVGFAEPLELAGVLAAAMQRTDAADLLLEAAERHDSLGARDKAFEARRRAFEIAPSHGRAARALVKVLERSQRAPAADEILRLHAESIDVASARVVHVERMTRAIEAGDSSVALQAIIDANLEGNVDGVEADAVDGVFDLVGLQDAIALRMELRADANQGGRRAAVLLHQARLFMGRLASPDRALEAWIEAVASDPDNHEALQALRAHATTMRDPMPLVEALIRAVSQTQAKTTRASCLREIETIAEERLADPSLALWALTLRAEIDSDQETILKTRERLVPRVKLQDGALQSAREALAAETGEARIEALRRIANILRGRPQSIDEYLAILCELVAHVDDERRWWIDLERACLRAGRADLLEERTRARLEGGVARVDVARMRTLLATLALRRGDAVLALAEARVLIQELPGHRPAAVMAWVLASAVGDPAAKAEAIELVAPSLTVRLRAALQSIAADMWLALGHGDDANRLGELAARSDAAEPRVLSQQARLALTGAKVEVRILEKACAVLLPGRRVLEAMALAYERAGDRRLAFSWTRRLYELCPWDYRLLDLLMVRGATAGNTEQLSEVVVEAIGSCFSMTVLAPILDKGLRALAAFDPAQATIAAHNVLSAVGPRYEPIRVLILDIAASGRNARLGIAVIERWLSAGAPAESHPSLLLRLAQHYHDLGDAEGAALAIVRGAVLGEKRDEFLACMERTLKPTSADGILARAHARALLLDPSDDQPASEVASAWRLLGAALWDLAGDRRAAVAAWARASELDELGGAEKLACDLEAFAGESDAHQALGEFALGLDDPRACARLLVVAAAIALRNNHIESALELAMRAVETDASRTDALVIIERAADHCRRIEVIDTAYTVVANGALGCVGRRAAHHRAARELDRRGREDLALGHAIAAFEADPINGAVLRLMLKLSEHGDPGDALQALRRASDLASDPDARAQWLKEGASLAARTPAHHRTAFEMALSAMNVSPDMEVAHLLGEVMKATIVQQPDERDILELRVGRALKACASKLEGPRGARVAILMSRISVDELAAPSLGMRWAVVALACSGDVDEYESLVDVATSLSGDREQSAAFLDEVIRCSESRAGPIGKALLTFASTLAYALDDGARGDALVGVAQRASSADDQQDPFADFGNSDRPGPLDAGGDGSEIARGGEALQADHFAPMSIDAFAGARESSRSSSSLPVAPPAIQPLEASAEPSFLAEALLTVADEIASRVAQEPNAEERAVGPAAINAQADPTIEMGAEELVVGTELSEPEMSLGVDDIVAAPLQGRPVSAPPASVQEPFVGDDALSRAWALQSRGEIQAAIQILEQAAGHDPSRAPDYDVRLRELYLAAGRNTQLLSVLDRIAERSEDPSLRTALLAEAALLCEVRGDADGARTRWMQTFAISPSHRQATAFLEREAAARGDHAQLAGLLAAKVASASTVDDLRDAVAHRALLLDQQMGQSQQAVVELEDALNKHGDDEGLLRLLAEITERGFGMLAAARCWARLARVTNDRATAVALACKAANVFLAEDLDGEARAAIAWLGEARAAPVLEILVALERRSGDARALGSALEQLATHSIEDALRRARWLIQAADASMLYGDGQQAVDRSMRAARIAPDDISIQLYAILLQYRVEGLGNLTQVRALGSRLDGVADRIGTDDVPLHAFLSAEVAGVLYGADAALEVLARRHGQVGLKPLIALGMAERLAAVGSMEHALPLFDIALGASDLMGVRSMAQVAFAAGRASLRAGIPSRAQSCLTIIESQPGAAEMALRLRADLDVVEKAQSRALVQQQDNVFPSSSPPVARASEPAQQPPPTVPTQPPPALPVLAAEEPPTAPILLVSSESRELRTSDPAQRLTPAYGSPSIPADAPPPSMAYVPVASTASEQDLFVLLAQGSIEAGDELAAILEHDPRRTHDLAAVRRRQVVIAPTDLRLLELLRDAAGADRNRAHVDAIEHVIASLTGRVPPSPPAMVQHEQPERVLAMLLRGVHTAASEAFGHLWTHAPHVLSREAIPFDLESMERVSFGAISPVGKAYAASVRVLGLGKASVYCHRSRGPLQAAVALTSPPSVVVTGAIEDSTELRYKLAFILAATLPANVMLFGMNQGKIRSLLNAMVAAFGPPEASRGTESGTVQLAGHLWHALPVRVQRRMNEIFGQPAGLSYEDLWARALQSARRGGLFVVGDLGTALRDTLDDPGVRNAVDLKSSDYLVQICAASASASDLVRLATSAEYAEARWRADSSERRGTWAPGPKQEGT